MFTPIPAGLVELLIFSSLHLNLSLTGESALMKTAPLLLTLSSAGIMMALLSGHSLKAQPAQSPGSALNKVKITTGSGFRTILSNGWPDHAPGAFPRRGNPNALSPQQYAFRVPVDPVKAERPVGSSGFWWGVAVNGVPFEPGTAETWKNERGSGWRYEAATGFMDLGLDEHHGHVQPTGAYHYHARPGGLVERLGGDGEEMRLIGWAADGFPLYTDRAPSDPSNAKSALKTLKSSYRLKPGKRPAPPTGPGGAYDGRFTEDWEYVSGSGDLDECNGRSGVTPEFPSGTYYYCVTAEFPFLPRFWQGQPDRSFAKGVPPPGGGPEGRPGEEPGGPRPVPPIVKALDLNKDGSLDASEITAAGASLRTLDKNGDGILTPDETRPGPPVGTAPGGRGGRPPGGGPPEPPINH